MIISKTPLRISFFGGGTDYPAWYRKYDGAVLATTIDKYCYITCRLLPPFFEHKSRICYNQIELIRELEEIRHPSIRECLKLLNIQQGLEVHYDADLPARTGLGSSSSFTVGLLHALHTLKRDVPSKLQLALEAIRIEQELIRENVGSQDQTSAAFGGFNRIEFQRDGGILVRPIKLAPERIKELGDHLMLFFSGFSRTASNIAKELIKELPHKTRELERIYQMVNEALRNLESDEDLTRFGLLLHESWLYKRSLASGITTSYIDYLYEKALQAGAVGGKILGAGGGGFLLLFVKPEMQSRVKQCLGEVLQIPFKFESNGSQIIYHDGSD